MIKILYSYENKKVFKNLYDEKYNIIMNFKGVYSGENRKDCEKWCKKHNIKITDIEKYEKKRSKKRN